MRYSYLTKNRHFIIISMMILNLGFTQVMKVPYDIEVRVKRGGLLIKKHQNLINELVQLFDLDYHAFTKVLDRQVSMSEDDDRSDDEKALKGDFIYQNPIEQRNEWNKEYYEYLDLAKECHCADTSIASTPIPEPKSSKTVWEKLIGKEGNLFFASLGPAQFQPTTFLHTSKWINENMDIYCQENINQVSQSTRLLLDEFLSASLFKYPTDSNRMSTNLAALIAEEEISIVALAAETAMHIELYRSLANLDISKDIKTLYFLHEAGYAEHRVSRRRCLRVRCNSVSALSVR